VDITEAIKNRRSIRHFLSRPVPEEMIRKLISEAIWSPSWGNTQPWEITVIIGNTLEQYRKENREAFFSGKPADPEIPFPEIWPDRHNIRYKDVGKSVLTSLSIARNDHESRLQYYGRMYSFFNAQVLLLLMIDKALPVEYPLLDIGLFLQSFFLLAHGKGLGTIALAASVNYPDILRKLFSITANQRIVIGVALGWPDMDDPVNGFDRKRTPADEAVRWSR